MLSGTMGWDMLIRRREDIMPTEPIIFEEVLGKVAGNVMTWMKSSSNSKDWNLTIILKKDEEYEYYLSLSETGEWMQFRTTNIKFIT